MSRVLVIGGDAAGMTAASAVRRLAPDAQVVVLERGHDTSYSACGVPYWVAGDIASDDDLVARTADEHRERGIDLRLGAEAVAVDPAGRTVTYRQDGGEHVLEWDRLVLATGARAVLPDLPGIDAEGVHTVKDLEDGRRIIAALAEGPRRAVVVGSGYIGIELAEALLARGLDVTVVERESTPLPIVEDEVGHVIADAMVAQGVHLVTSAEVTGFAVEAGRVTAVRTADGDLPADLVVAALGVAARSDLLDVEKGPKGGIVTDDQQRVADLEHVWAAGDCVVTRDRLTGSPVFVALGTHANKQGLVAGESVAASLGADWSGRVFDGVVQTAITKFCDLEVSRTGLGRAAAQEAGLEVVAATIETTTRAGYYPGAEPMTLWGLAERGSRRLLGVQVAGGSGAGLRIDPAALALWNGMTVDELVMTDLAYAPPFSSVWSPVQVLARSLAKALTA
ncbi:MAG: FAD-dependent oxidoreductase [Aeromicrobium erythreum]